MTDPGYRQAAVRPSNPVLKVTPEESDGTRRAYKTGRNREVYAGYMPPILPWVYPPTHTTLGTPTHLPTLVYTHHPPRPPRAPSDEALGSKKENSLGGGLPLPLRTLKVLRIKGGSAQSYSALPCQFG